MSNAAGGWVLVSYTKARTCVPVLASILSVKMEPQTTSNARLLVELQRRVVESAVSLAVRAESLAPVLDQRIRPPILSGSTAICQKGPREETTSHGRLRMHLHI